MFSFSLIRDSFLRERSSIQAIINLLPKNMYMYIGKERDAIKISVAKRHHVLAYHDCVFLFSSTETDRSLLMPENKKNFR